MKWHACRILVAAAFGTLLTACVAAGPPAAPQSAAATLPKSTPSNVIPIVQPDRAHPPEQTEKQVTALRTHNMPSPVAKPVAPDVIVGLAQAEVEAMIGKPHAVRDEPPATVWVYRSTRCTLAVYFYLDVKSNKLTALSYNAEPVDVQPAGGPTKPVNKQAARSCLGQIRTENSGKP